MTPRTVRPLRNRQELTARHTPSAERSEGLCFGSRASIAVGCSVASLTALIVASVQSGFFSVIRPLGTVPDLCLGFTVALGMLFGWRFGAVFGVASGFFADALLAGGFSARILLYLVCGIAAGMLMMPDVRPLRDTWRYVSTILSACAAKQIILMLYVLLTAPYGDIGSIFTQLFLREVACTALFSLPSYLISAAAFAVYKRSKASKRRYLGK